MQASKWLYSALPGHGWQGGGNPMPRSAQPCIVNKPSRGKASSKEDMDSVAQLQSIKRQEGK